MKKYISIAMSMLFLSPLTFAATENSSVITKNNEDYQAVFINDQLKIDPKNIREENKDLRYTIEADYPQIIGDNLSETAIQFNKLMNDMVNKEIDKFKNYVKEDMPHMQTLPEEVRNNSFNIDYDIDVIKPNDKNLIVVRFIVSGMQAGRAHPYHHHRVINYDLDQGKILTLSELFQPKSHYLAVISQFANQKLHSTLEDKFMIDTGTEPTDINYKNWNIESDGILITFDEYQVAPYAAGSQEVHVPYEVLKNIISPNAPIAPCVADAKNCLE